MPELPEVEVVVRSLGDFLLGQKITDIELRRAKSLPQGIELVKQRALEQRINSVIRRAKFIQIGLENGYQILTHLKMTGQLIYVGGELIEEGKANARIKDEDGNVDQRKRLSPQTAGGGHPTADWTAQLPGSHTRVIWTLMNEGGTAVNTITNTTTGKNGPNHLYFNDQRVFGWMQVLSEEEIEKLYYSKLGPDANTAGFTAEYLAEKIASKRIPIKTAIMDNAIVCGLGNIYAAETCWACELDPKTPAREVPVKKLEELTLQSKEILAKAIKAGGTTFDGKYVDAEGKSGNFSEQLNVYGRAGEKCYRCGAILENIRLGGRATVFCPSCQK